MRVFFTLFILLAAAGLGAAEPAAAPTPLSPPAPQALSPAAAAALPEALSPTAAPAPLSSSAAVPEAPLVQDTDAVPTPVPTPGPFKAELWLKDGQSAVVTIVDQDSVFLGVLSASGKLLNVPWSVVAAIKPQDAGVDMAPWQARINNDHSDLKLNLQARDPKKAFQKALWPGFFIHGAGHKEAGRNEAYISLLGAELFGVLVAGFGGIEMVENGNQKATSQQLVGGGLGLFLVTWVWDLALAPSAARSFNAEHGLALEPTRDGLKLALRF